MNLRCTILTVLLFSRLTGFAQFAVFDAANQGANIRAAVEAGIMSEKVSSQIKTASDALAATRRLKEIAEDSRRLAEQVGSFGNTSMVQKFNTLYRIGMSMPTLYTGYYNSEAQPIKKVFNGFFNEQNGVKASEAIYKDLTPDVKNKTPRQINASLTAKRDLQLGIGKVTSQMFISNASYYQNLATQIEAAAAELSSNLSVQGKLTASPAERTQLMIKCYEMMALAADMRTKSAEMLRNGSEGTSAQAMSNRQIKNQNYIQAFKTLAKK